MFMIYGILIQEMFKQSQINFNELVKKKTHSFWTRIKSLALSKFVSLFLSLPNPPVELIKELEVFFFSNFYGMQALIE